MNDDTDGATYHQQDENLHEAWELLQEADAKRRERELETLYEMSKGLDDGQDTVDEDEWLALSRDYQPGDPIGYGAEPADAIRDLKEQTR